MLHQDFVLTTDSYYALKPVMLPRIRKRCRNFGIEEIYAEDIYTETVLTLDAHFAQGKTLYENCKLMTLATRMAYNHVSNWYRKYDTDKTQPFADDNYEAQLIFDDAAEKDYLAFLRSKLEGILSSLKPRQRRVIELYYVEGYSDKEVIAQQLVPYKSEAVLRMTRKRILKKLQKKVVFIGKMGYA